MLRTRFRTRARFIPAVSGGGGGYPITNSLRFNDDDSAYLSRTPSVAGNRKTWTWSGWVKRGSLDVIKSYDFFTAGTAGDGAVLRFQQDAKIRCYDYGGSFTFNLVTTSLFRDVSGWYHIIFAIDTTQATASDRVKLFVNGSQVTAFDTAVYPALNQDCTYFNNSVLHNIGRNTFFGAQYFDGYMAEVNFIDGQALTADDFGQIDAATGEWSPKAYAGTYGTNGFYLPFDGNADDDSGNGNNWTENSLAPKSYMIDTPTNNFATLNPLQNTIDVTYFEGNLKTTQTANYRTVTATQFVSSGKWYFEHYGKGEIGVVRDGAFNPTNRLLVEAGEYAYNWFDGQKLNNNVQTAYGDAWGATDITSCALDLDAGTIEFFKNNVSQGIAFTGLPAGFYTFAIGHNNETEWVNFGADSSFGGSKTGQGNTDVNGKGDFYYQPPFGYLALCTDNLPAPAIEQPETQFNVVTYTGKGGTQAITGVGFQPDFVWIKQRSDIGWHILQDSVRGAGLTLFSNQTFGDSGGAGDLIASFDSDGFTVNQNIDGFTDNDSTNGSGDTYVAWCWKAGGTAVSNTDGVTSGVFTAVTSQVSANVDSGFSIQTYTAPASGKPSWGHGLGVAPKVLILKRRDGTGNWEFISPELIGASYGLRLNTTAAATNYTNNYAFFDSSKIDIGNATYNLTGSADYVAYTFAEVEGFSKFGAYIGNGSANGPFVYTGFKPAFIMYKRAIGGTGNWLISDNMREGYNWDNPSLYPNLDNAESSGSSLDILSNGFKINNAVAGSDHNANGSTYIFMAFAEHPFKEALAR